MKLTGFLLLLSAMTLSAKTYSQAARLNLQVENANIVQVFDQIEKISEFGFFFKTDQMDLTKRYNLSVEDASIDQILAQVLDLSKYKYQIVDRNIVISKISGNTAPATQDQKTVTGKVTDNNGSSLPGATIVVKGTTRGTITDADGNYSLTSVKDDDILEFSFVGMTSQDITVGAKAVINIVLKSENIGVNEVVVVGYGSQKRSDVTGSVTSVPTARLEKTPVTNLMHAIEGSTAGLNVTQTSSVPGSSGTMQIRGINSINASTSPFIVVDGMPFFGKTNDINPNDIASIEVLKDASAVAIYGTRGANGVILITTKRGKTGKPQIHYSGHAGIENIEHKLEPSSPASYVQKYADYLTTRNLPQTQVLPNQSEIDNYNAGITTDWLKEATQLGSIQDHNVSINGGTNNVKYYVATGYLHEKGVVKGYQYKRVSIRSNLDVNITRYLKVGTSLGFTNNNYDGGRANLLNATAMSPYSVPYDSNGNLIIYPMYPELLFSNPLLGLTTDRVDRERDLTGNGYAELTPGFIKGLKFRINGSYSLTSSAYRNYSGRADNDLVGSATVENTDKENWVVENLVTYIRDFGKNHIDFTGLYSAQQETYFWSGAYANTFINDKLSYYNLGAGANQSSASDGYRTNLLSQMGRINYSYDSRYLLTLTARRDGYSAFGANTNKYGVFPSAAFGWNIYKEKFMQNASNIVDNLKLRLSYGEVGNQAIGHNQTSTLASTVRFPFNSISTIGVLASTLGNANLHWESTTSANIGLDFGLLKNRVSGTIEGYKTKTKDILLKRNIPTITGYNNIWDNLGKMQNVGLEISLHTVNVHTDNFQWDTRLNFSTNKNKILSLYGDGKDDIGNRWFIGHPVDVVYDYQKVGVWQVGQDNSNWDPSAKPGDLKFKDQLTVDTNGDGIPDATDGKITADDKVILGTTSPKWYGGMTNDFSYKNFNLSIFIQTSQGALKNNHDLNYADEAGRRNVPAQFHYWTPTNKSDVWPGLYSSNKGYGFPSDASYTRIKNVTFSYNFSKELSHRMGFDNLSLYVSGQNLYTFTKWIGWDPEDNYLPRGSSTSTATWENNYPPVRSIVFGVNVGL